MPRIVTPANHLRLLGASVLTAAVAFLLLALADRPAVGAASGPTTHFSGQIAGGTGRFAHARGTVRLVLHASTAGSRRPGTSPPVAYTMTLSGSSCPAPSVKPPGVCLALSGTLSGTAVGTTRNPDVGTAFALTGHGRVVPLGAVSASGATRGLGFIARGRFPLTLQLRSATGRITINAQGPLVKGFTSPF